MLKYIYVAIALGTLVACNNESRKKELSEVQIINESFLSIVDTAAYKYHTLRPIPFEHDEPKDITITSSLLVTVYFKLLNINTWKNSMLKEIENNKDSIDNFKDYKSLIVNSTFDTTEKNINVSHLTKSGKYQLIENNDPHIQTQKNAIGHLKFSRVLFNEKKGIGLLVTTIQDNTKSGIVKLILLINKNLTWTFYKDYTLEIW